MRSGMYNMQLAQYKKYYIYGYNYYYIYDVTKRKLSFTSLFLALTDHWITGI